SGVGSQCPLALSAVEMTHTKSITSATTRRTEPRFNQSPIPFSSICALRDEFSARPEHPRREPTKLKGAEATMRLRGKVALVTGAQQGIGRGIALAFAHEGADVAVNYLDDRAAAETVLRHVQAAGRRATLVQGDVARPEEAKAMVTRVADELGGLDILVNNAGVYPRVPFLEMRESDWDLVLDVNLKGGFFCAQAAAQTMIAGRRRGSVINLASQAIRGAVRGVHYSASKGGV